MAVLISTNPAQNYKKIGEVKVSTKPEIRKKVKEARDASIEWNRIGVRERIKCLREVYKALYSRRNEISEIASKEMGFPIRDQKFLDMGDGFNYFKWYLNNGAKLISPEITNKDKNETHQIFYEPYGVAAVIQPWNFPFCQWSWSVVPNLVVGNTVVFKHSEECPLSGKLIEDIIKRTNLPKGVFNEVYGDGSVGEFLLDQDIDLIAFTGSVGVGKKVYKKAASKFVKVLLELGGSAPGIVFSDANIEETLEHIFAVRFTNNGQACDGLKRLIVHKDIFNDVVDGLTKILKSKKIGNTLDSKTDFGPLVSERQQKLIVSQVKEATRNSAKIVIGGKVPEDFKGAYFEPTILTNVKKSMRVWKEEVFGPVLPIVQFDNEDEAVSLANDTDYGLGGYIYSKDLDRARRVASRLETGMVSINGANYVQPFNPFGGYKFSGLGREHSRIGLHDLCQVKVVSSTK